MYSFLFQNISFSDWRTELYFDILLVESVGCIITLTPHTRSSEMPFTIYMYLFLNLISNWRITLDFDILVVEDVDINFTDLAVILEDLECLFHVDIFTFEL